MLHNPYLCHFFILLLTFLTYWESQCAKDRLWKKLLYIFLWIIDINDRFNVCSTISYYNMKHIRSRTKGNYFRLVTLKTVNPHNWEFCPYDIAETLDKQYVLAGYHSFVKSRQRIIVFFLHISLQYWIRQHQLVIGHRLKRELILILRCFCKKYFIYFLAFFYFRPISSRLVLGNVVGPF